jgi:DNA invertase Pin-like site-specific DNA recombinase
MAVAELERAIIRERVKAGIAAARAKGKHLGRPTGSHGISAKKRAQLKAEV